MTSISKTSVESPSVTVGAFVANAPPSLRLSFLAGARGAETRYLRTPRIQKLGLIMRGHQLVADDLVEVRRTRPGQLTGSTPDLLREHMEIRGLGILNIRELFGVSAVSGPKQIGLNIRLERWEEASEVDRLGLEARTVEILGVAVPHFVLPVSPGRNLSTLVET